MENNEQNNFEATNNVNPVNNVEPTPTVESTPEVKTEDTIMVAEPAARPAIEPTPAPVVPAPQPMPAPEVSSRPEPVVETTPVEPTVEPEPVVIPKGEKPKGNNKGVVTLLLILILIVLAVCGYFVYDKYVKDLITKPSTNETSGNQANNVPEPTPNVEPTNDGSNSINASDNENKESVLNPEEGIYEKMPIGDASIGENIIIKNIRNTTDTNAYIITDEHTFDVYLDDKLLVKDFIGYSHDVYDGGSESEYKGTFLNKIGIIKDTDTSSNYIAFVVGVRNNTLYIVDASGKILFQKDGDKDANAGGFILKATNERFKTGDYKYVSDLDTSTNKNVDLILTYSVDDNKNEGLVNSVRISSGNPIESIYKTYSNTEIQVTGR